MGSCELGLGGNGLIQCLGDILVQGCHIVQFQFLISKIQEMLTCRAEGVLFLSRACLLVRTLKADQPHPRNYPHTPTDYRHSDEYLDW